MNLEYIKSGYPKMEFPKYLADVLVVWQIYLFLVLESILLNFLKLLDHSYF